MLRGGRLGIDNSEIVSARFLPFTSGNDILVDMKTFIKASGFFLIAVGTAGLLLNEYVWDARTYRTIIYAIVSLVGFVNLAFAHFGMRDSK